MIATLANKTRDTLRTFSSQLPFGERVDCNLNEVFVDYVKEALSQLPFGERVDCNYDTDMADAVAAWNEESQLPFGERVDCNYAYRDDEWSGPGV